MSSAAAVASASSSTRRGAVAPLPTILHGVKQGQRIEVRPGEPVYLLLPSRVGAAYSISGLNQRTPFRVSNEPPPRADRNAGTWFRLEVAAGAKKGTRDRLNLDVRPAAPRALGWTEARFTLEVGAKRYY